MAETPKVERRGGYRPGSGRPTKFNELRIQDVALKAIEEKYGGLKEGFLWLLNYDVHKDPGLVRYAWGHAIGNPVDRIAVASLTPQELYFDKLDQLTDDQIRELEANIAGIAAVVVDSSREGQEEL